MNITDAKFVGSSTRVSEGPKLKLPEFAFIGRSNVGKSSLINMLCARKKLALTSSTPGKTKLINHFIINDSWYVVDLPGYGYAKISKTQRDGLSKLINNYLDRSDNLICLFVLVDSRHDIQKIDLEFINELGSKGIPFAIIYTKSDKVGPVALEKQIEKNKSILLETWEELPPMFKTSAQSGMGREELLTYIEQILNSLDKS